MSTLGVVIFSLPGTGDLAQCLDSVRWADAVAVRHLNSAGEILSTEAVKSSPESPATDWYLHLWSGERVEVELREELESILRDQGPLGFLTYLIPVRSRLLGCWVEGSFSGPSPSRRLCRRIEELPPGGWDRARLKESQPAAGVLRGWIGDYSLADLGRGVDCVNSISSLWASRSQSRGVTVGPAAILVQSLKVFSRLLFMNGPLRPGFAGLTLSILAAYATLLTGAKVWEARLMGERQGEAHPRGPLSERIWGETPAGFRRVVTDRCYIMLVREGWESELLARGFLRSGTGGGNPSRFHGRGSLSFLPLNSGDRALVRPYYHGGPLRRLTGDFFFTWPPRPFRELALTEEARRRGISTPEVLAAWVEKLWGPFYRGWLVTLELRGADDLWASLRDEAYRGKDKEMLLMAVAGCIKDMHRGGVLHGDLNLKNILVRREEDQIAATVIDFDKARLFTGEVPRRAAGRNLSRLLRSVCRLDPQRRYFTEEDWEVFVRAYKESGV